MSRVLSRVVLAAGTLVCLAAAGASAQVTTTGTETKMFEVIAVDGNQAVVRLPEGTREITFPEGYQLTVEGRQILARELKPGMKGTATITTRTTVTPVSVTEVKNGTVMQSSPGRLVVRTDEGVRAFTQSQVDQRGVKILREGRPATLSDFRPGDTLTATIVTTMPPQTVTEKEVSATLAREAAPAPVAAPAAAQAPAPVAKAPEASPAPAPTPVATSGAAAAAAPAELPRTASLMPLLGLAGLASLLTGAALTARRRRLGD